MDFKEFLKNQKEINLGCIASKMWPKNTSADTYMSRKLNGTDGRTWTEKDTIKAKEALYLLGSDLVEKYKDFAPKKTPTK